MSVAALTALVLAAASWPAVAADSIHMRNLGSGLELGASLQGSQTYSDNFFYEEKGGHAVHGLVLAPELALKQRFGRAFAALNAGLQFARFDLPKSDSDFNDGAIGAVFEYDGGVRNFFTVSAATRHGHDPFGTDRTSGVGATLPDRNLDLWTTNNAAARYRYGAPTATLNIELSGGYAKKDYTTNEATTVFLDFRKASLAQTLFFNYSPKTAALVELGEESVRFDRNAPKGVDRDAKEYRLRAGVRWKATAKTTGDIRVGGVRRSLDDKRINVLTGLSWDAKVRWEPFSKTSLSLETGRSSQESFLTTVSVVDNRDYAVSLSQGLGNNFRTIVTARRTDSDFVGTSRRDAINTYALSGIYSFRSSVAVFASLYRSQRDSTSPPPNPSPNFRASAVVVGIRVSP